MARILVIEDEKDIQDILEYNLRQAGHKVNLASTGQDGLKLAREKKPDLVLLDLMLPDISGTEVCKTLKQDPATRDTQVLILTAKGEEIDRVVGFELGADDYVVKPFSVRELVLRIQAILRRVSGDLGLSRVVIDAEVRRLYGAPHERWIVARLGDPCPREEREEAQAEDEDKRPHASPAEFTRLPPRRKRRVTARLSWRAVRRRSGSPRRGRSRRTPPRRPASRAGASRGCRRCAS